MKLDLIEKKETTFGTAQKDLFKIVQKFINNENLKKLLYYQTKDALKLPNLTTEESLSLINKNIKVIPKVTAEEEVESYIIISFDNFVTNGKNPQFRDNTITFNIICHLDSWIMENYQLRPYMIMGEIDGMLNGRKLNGIGQIDFIGANQMLLSSDLAGFTLIYRVVNDV